MLHFADQGLISNPELSIIVVHASQEWGYK